MVYLHNKFSNKLIIDLKYDENKLNEHIFQYISRDKLRFKYKYDKFGASENMKLMEFLTKQNKDWKLNKQGLNEICVLFKNKYSDKILQEKCLNYGYEYNNQNDKS